MTDITKHVVSLELCKELVEVGVVVDSLYYWAVDEFEKKLVIKDHVNKYATTRAYYPAAISSELVEILPDTINSTEYLTIQVGTTVMTPKWGWQVWYWGADVLTQHAKTMPDALAKMLIYLKKQGLLTPTHT